MGSGATKREILEKQLDKRLQDPKTEPLISLPRHFLEDITCGFSTERELGRGACGVVYKGVLRSGKAIAVKKIFDTHLLGNDNQVENEIICLTEVGHQNVVQLVGYCVETKSEVVEHSGKHVMAEKRACLLCFEFLCNGSLDKHLSDDTSGLDWDKRYKIIRGVCRGLHYLHDKCRIAHQDLKPQNILMDDTLMPKIADFYLSRLSSQEKSRIVTAKLQGTPGYMAPECIKKRSISFEADIFSLGVIIIEIITGHRDYPNISETTETSLKHYTDEVVGSWRNRLIEITPMHMSPEMLIQQVQQCISIALKCLEPDSNKRPTSLDIVQSLNAVEPKCMSPGNPPSVFEKDRRNQNLQVNVNIINIPNTISAINGMNECANLFQWVTSAISSPKPQLNETQKEKLHGDVRQLQGDLQCLSDTLPAMYNLIDQAEWRIHEHYVAELLSRLKDAVYDAEDILDEFRWYETKLSVEGSAISVEPVIDFFHSVTQGSFNKVTDIQTRLNHLARQLEKTGLLQAVPRFDKSFSPETTSFPTEAKIFGRDQEKNNLIRLLGVPTNNSAGPSGHKRKRSAVCSAASNQICATIDANEATITSVPVLPIVGIGGVGKTTLAQYICNHSKVKHHFHLIIWICVSDDFDVKRLTKEAIEQSSGDVPKNGNLNFLQGALANSLNTRRFLLILDDMWNENELDWKRFYAPFRNALQGSMMLVTTRSPKVADIVCTMDPFPLEGLKDDVFRKFFMFCVFGPNSSNIDPQLEQIGEKILPKLRGSPLAAKTLGGLLGMSLELAHWDRILKSQLWELQQNETDILLALWLSYMYLPLYLKRCFSFCAVYPKDYIFKKEDLVEIWVAEGLVEHHPNISLHHTGGQYFEELAHLSFFQKYPRSHKKYVIHDLMHDMAQLVSKDECFIVKEKNDLLKIPQNVRHLLVLKGGDVQCSDLLRHDMAQHRKLRTLLCDLSLKSKTGNTLMEQWCAELLCMRVIVCSSISKWGLPGSIGNLKHLRYLKILGSYLCKSLPAGFCRLYNMQLFYAKKWVIDDIPICFRMLINLQKFESMKYQFHHKHYLVDICEGATDREQISQFKFEKYNSDSLPSGFNPQNIPKITSLEFLHSDNKSISFSMNLVEIPDSTFSSLTDVEIRDCQNLSSLEQFLQPAYMPIIKKIRIDECGSLEWVPTERFRDLGCLEELFVSDCPKIKSQGLCAPFLRKLSLKNSGKLGCDIDCRSLTILHLSKSNLESIKLQIWKLQELEIKFCASLRFIKDSETISTDLFHGGGRSRMENTPLPTHLTIMYCEKLQTIDDLLYLPAIETICIVDCGLLSLPTNRLGSFPLLKDLNISRCQSLNWQSGMLLPSSLQKLILSSCGDFSAWFLSCLENLTSLESLQICDCECIVSIPGHLWSSNLKSLQRLKIIRCSKLISVGGVDAFAGIRDLFIAFCPELKEINQPLQRCSFPMGVPSAESSRSVRGLGKGVSGKPYPRLCNARRPRLEPGTFQSQMDIPIIDWIDTAMEGPVTASLGPMAPLLRKVCSLKFMAPTHIQVSPSDDDIKHFKKHLEVLCTDLLEPEETSSMPRWWRKEVRELLYDTEDRLDKVILLPGGDFSELIAVVEDACKRRKRLKLAPNDKTIKPDPGEVCVSCLPPESTSHELSITISSGSCLVGLDELMNKLVKQLAFDDHNQKQLKVVPILGFPGVGKTTASGTLYHEHRGKFQCSAFVQVSRTPDMRSLLFSILLQIKAPRFWAFPDVHYLTDGIKKHLKGKRYFIILDGLWTASVWDIISRAFPDGNYGSRIVTTTQISDVALACCRYYPDYIEMSPLNDDQSERLFFTIMFGSEDCCPSDFKQVSYKIIKKCAGLPLAIVNVASLLGRELSVEKWEHVQDSLPSILRTNDTTNEGMNDFSSDTCIGSEGSQLARGTEIQKWKHTQYYCSSFEGLKQVLMYIYNNFPPHLKTCLLYFSMYPEGYLVRKHDLVRQWVAEGFMNDVGRRSAEELAGDYFDELVCSGIVQPVDIKYGSEVLSCTVHHMVLDLIRHKSKEMNFIITVDHLQSSLALPDQVRRLSIQFGGAKSADIPENIEISNLRSLLFCGFIDCVPSVVDYEFLRVLILDIWTDGDETEFDLTRICELLRLRYLKIQCNLMVNLPDEISGLKYLETLEVDARLSAVPSDIGRLEKLLHLLLPSEAILPQGHGSLTSSLLTLGCFDLSKNSSRNVIDLAQLTNLQDLRLTCSTSTILSKHLVGNMKHLALVLGKLNNLRSLALNGVGASSQSICDDSLSSVSPSPALLEKLELRPRICTLSRLPKWIGELSRLAILKIEVVVLSNDDIAILEGLASLTALSLRVLTENVEWIFEKGFPALRYFKFVSTSPYMSLLEGAMPNVQKLKLAFNANRLHPEYHPGIFGFKHMTSLTEVTVKIGGAADESSKGDAERVLKDAFSNHPSSPIFNVQWVDYIF